MRDPIYTIGHSTHAVDVFLKLLLGAGVRNLADVRLIPKSGRYPHFSAPALGRLLALNSIVYRHFPGLGGRRKPRRDSINTAWRVEAFRGYADYIRTDPFRDSFGALLNFAAAEPTAIMCAEALWWQCHRRLLADALLVRGVPVLHIMSSTEPKPHELSEFAREVDGEVIYPGLL